VKNSLTKIYKLLALFIFLVIAGICVLVGLGQVFADIGSV